MQAKFYLDAEFIYPHFSKAILTKMYMIFFCVNKNTISILQNVENKHYTCTWFCLLSKILLNWKTRQASVLILQTARKIFMNSEMINYVVVMHRLKWVKNNWLRLCCELYATAFHYYTVTKRMQKCKFQRRKYVKLNFNLRIIFNAWILLSLIHSFISK